MANINEIEKDLHTNTFWVNPTIYDDHGQRIKPADENGVSFPAPSYKDGIEIPDKLVTINGATNYHLLDAINLDWDRAAIPWATKITKWGGSGTTIDEGGNVVLINRSDMYAPDYEYNKPAEGGWTDGTIKETEDVADILNYLIYRVVSLDFFMDHWNDDQLQSPALRLVNHRTDWYSRNSGTGSSSSSDINPDVIDGDSSSIDIDHTSDNRFTVRPDGLIINLYPYLVSRYWVGPQLITTNQYDLLNTETAQYKTKLFDSNQNNRPGVVMSDTGWLQQREQIYCGDGYKKIVKGHENFDIFEVETRSNSNQIEFVSRNKHVLDGYVQKNLSVVEYQTEDPDSPAYVGGVETEITVESGSTVQTNYFYKLPVVAYKCLDKPTYPYNTYDVIKTLLRYNHAGIQNTRYREPKYSAQTPQFDPSFVNTTFGVTIAKSQNAVNGFAAGSTLHNVTIYKGNNTLIDLSLQDKSAIITDPTGRPVTMTFKDSYNKDVPVNTYKTIIGAPDYERDYNDQRTYDLFKAKINFDAEFGPRYDKGLGGSDEEMIKKSFVYPYFIVKRDIDTTPDYLDICNSINVAGYKNIYSNEFDSDNNEHIVLFSSKKYGQIIYEKYNNEWCYFYLPPAKYRIEIIEDGEETIEERVNNIPFDEYGEYKVKLFALMYYPIDDITTNRLLNPLWAELAITIKDELTPEVEMNFNNIETSDINEDNYIVIPDYITVESGFILSELGTINEDNYIES